MDMHEEPQPHGDEPKKDRSKPDPKKVDRSLSRGNWAEDLVVDPKVVLSLGSAVKEDDVGRVTRLVPELDREETEIELLQKVRATQHHADYRPDEHRVWRLVTSALENAPNLEARVVTIGRAQLGITSDCIPSLESVRSKVQWQTGWDVAGIPGYLPSDVFAQMLANRILPVVIGMRAPDGGLDENPTAESLSFSDSSVDTDLISDLWGVAPLLTIPPLASFLQTWGTLGHQAYLEPDHLLYCERIDALASLFFHTVGFGLLAEGASGNLKTYGAAFNTGEAALVDTLCEIIPMSLEDVIAAPTPAHLRTPPLLLSVKKFRTLPGILEALKQQFEF